MVTSVTMSPRFQGNVPESKRQDDWIEEVSRGFEEWMKFVTRVVPPTYTFTLVHTARHSATDTVKWREPEKSLARTRRAPFLKKMVRRGARDLVRTGPAAPPRDQYSSCCTGLPFRKSIAVCLIVGRYQAAV